MIVYTKVGTLHYQNMNLLMIVMTFMAHILFRRGTDEIRSMTIDLSKGSFEFLLCLAEGRDSPESSRR